MPKLTNNAFRTCSRETSDYRLITADCVSTCVALVCHTVNCVRQVHKPQSMFCSSAPLYEDAQTQHGPKNICRKVLGLQSGLAAANQIHQHHQARCLRTILEYQRHSWETYSGFPLNTSVLIRWSACDIRRQRWDWVQYRTVCSTTYQHILCASACF